MIQECGGDGSAHWLDDGSEHPHRIALSTHADCAGLAQHRLQELSSQQGLKVRAPCCWHAPSWAHGRVGGGGGAGGGQAGSLSTGRLPCTPQARGR